MYSIKVSLLITFSYSSENNFNLCTYIIMKVTLIFCIVINFSCTFLQKSDLKYFSLTNQNPFAVVRAKINLPPIKNIILKQISSKNLHEECILKIINFIFKEDKDITFISTKKSNSIPIGKYGRISYKIHIESNFTCIPTNSDYIQIVESINDVYQSLNFLLFSRNWYENNGPRNKFLLITSTNESYFKKIYEKYWKSGILDLFILQNNKQNSILTLFGAYIFDTKSLCGQRVILNKIGSWNYDADSLSENISDVNFVFEKVNSFHFFEDKTLIHKKRSFENCTLVATIMDKLFKEPYIFQDDPKRKGIMIQPLLLFKQKYKINLIFLFENMTTQLSYVKDINLIFKYFYNKFDAFAIATGLRRERFLRSDVSEIFYRDPYLWVIPKPKKVYLIQMLTTVFSTTIWILITTLFLLTTTLLCIINKCGWKNFFFLYEKYLMYVLSYTLALPTKFFLKNAPTKIVLVIYMFYSMNICYLYQGQLIGVLTNPKYVNEINSIEQMLNSKLDVVTFILLLQSLEKVKGNPTVQKLINISKPSELDGVVRLKLLAEKQNFATTVMDSYLKINKQYESKIKVLGNEYLSQIEMNYMFRKYHPLYLPINKLIKNCLEAGLNNKWLLEVMNLKSDTFLKGDNKNVALKFEHLRDVFVILLFGNLLATFLFFCEVFVYKIVMFFKKI